MPRNMNDLYWYVLIKHEKVELNGNDIILIDRFGKKWAVCFESLAYSKSWNEEEK